MGTHRRLHAQPRPGKIREYGPTIATLSTTQLSTNKRSTRALGSTHAPLPNPPSVLTRTPVRSPRKGRPHRNTPDVLLHQIADRGAARPPRSAAPPALQPGHHRTFERRPREIVGRGFESVAGPDAGELRLAGVVRGPSGTMRWSRRSTRTAACAMSSLATDHDAVLCRSCYGKVLSYPAVVMRTSSLLACGFWLRLARTRRLANREEGFVDKEGNRSSVMAGRLCLRISQLRIQVGQLARWSGHARARMSLDSHRRLLAPPERRWP